MIFTQFNRLDSGAASFPIGYLNHAPGIEACSNVGTGFGQHHARRFSTNLMPENFHRNHGASATRLSDESGLVADQVVTIESYITGAIGRGALCLRHQAARDKNGPAGAAAKPRASPGGSVDVLRLKWDGTNWLRAPAAVLGGPLTEGQAEPLDNSFPLRFPREPLTRSTSARAGPIRQLFFAAAILSWRR